MKPKKKKLTLDQTHPELLKEWDFERNWNELGLRPEDITFGSGKKVYWICGKFKEDKWEDTLTNRTLHKTICPFCSGHKVNNRTCLATTHPKLCHEWDYDRNLKELNLTPYDVSYGSEKYVYWICNKFPKEDRWLSKILNRSINKHNCPFCDNHKANIRNCLQTKCPNVAALWHPTLNGNITPYDVVPGSQKKATFQCKTYPEDVWTANIYTVCNSPKTGCPYCSGRTLCYRTSLENLFPEISKEWHPIKNKNLTPKDISSGNHSLVWWLCKKGHKYKASPHNRTGNDKTGCPHCPTKNQTMVFEFLEQNNFNFEFNHPVKVFKTKNPLKIDFFLPSYNLFIEYDGHQHFQPTRFGGISQEKANEAFIKQQLRDQSLVKYCNENDINLLKIDGRKYHGQKLQEYLESYFLYFIFILGFHNV